MVNDQLIRIHHLKLLSYEKLASEKLQQKLTLPGELPADGDSGGNSSPFRPPGSLSPSSPPPSLSAPSSPIHTKTLSQSAPEARLLGDQHHEQQSTNNDRDDLSPSIILREKKRKHSHKRYSSISSFAHQLGGNNITPNSDGSKYNNTDTDAHNRSGDGGTGDSNKKGSQQHSTSKRRSSWRHLLSPSYKSRSEEFHKLFVDEIPKNERLIADYSCALHREILIQGRVYISINYIAFYSNLFSWITKLVVRLRDIVEIYKANTARIIPNAIQIVTNTDDKHVFASFIARDKSYMMMWRIWRNNLLKERMSDQEIRSLVHLSYGKDLGMGDDEELKINSPDPRTPANSLPAATDGNNNSKCDSSTKIEDHIDDETCRAIGGNSNLSDIEEARAADSGNDESGHTRYHSVDYTNMNMGDNSADTTANDQAKVMSELSHRLYDFSNSLEGQDGVDCDGAANLSNYSNSSAVVLDTPDTNNANSQLYRRDPNVTHEEEKEEEEGEEGEGRKAEYLPMHDKDVATGQILGLNRQESSSQAADNYQLDGSGGKPPHVGVELNGSSGETVRASIDHQSEDEATAEAGESRRTGSEQACVDDFTLEANCNEPAAEQTDDEPQVNTKCDCEEHQGVLIADEEFGINVDTLFSLIFTNSKFMRNYMIKRGMTDTTVSKWNRSPSYSGSSNNIISGNGGGGGDGGGDGGGGGDGDDKSISSSTLSSSEARGRQNSFDSFNIYLAKTPVKQKQVRQLNYSVNVNHVWAKQVQVEERQCIYSAEPGVYVLKSQTINSGIPCSEAFTIDLTYCLTTTSHLNRSRMLVHGHVNFIKDKQSWKIAMIKSLIEKESMQGINDFISDLIGCIKEYVDKKKKTKLMTKGGERVSNDNSLDSTVTAAGDVKLLATDHEQNSYNNGNSKCDKPVRLAGETKQHGSCLANCETNKDCHESCDCRRGKKVDNESILELSRGSDLSSSSNSSAIILDTPDANNANSSTKPPFRCNPNVTQEVSNDDDESFNNKLRSLLANRKQHSSEHSGEPPIELTSKCYCKKHRGIFTADSRNCNGTNQARTSLDKKATATATTSCDEIGHRPQTSSSSLADRRRQFRRHNRHLNRVATPESRTRSKCAICKSTLTHNHLFSNANLVKFSTIVIVLLVIVMAISNLLILRRLDRIQMQLAMIRPEVQDSTATNDQSLGCFKYQPDNQPVL